MEFLLLSGECLVNLFLLIKKYCTLYINRSYSAQLSSTNRKCFSLFTWICGFWSRLKVSAGRMATNSPRWFWMFHAVWEILRISKWGMIWKIISTVTQARFPGNSIMSNALDVWDRLVVKIIFKMLKISKNKIQTKELPF